MKIPNWRKIVYPLAIATYLLSYGKLTYEARKEVEQNPVIAGARWTEFVGDPEKARVMLIPNTHTYVQVRKDFGLAKKLAPEAFLSEGICSSEEATEDYEGLPLYPGESKKIQEELFEQNRRHLKVSYAELAKDVQRKLRICLSDKREEIERKILRKDYVLMSRKNQMPERDWEEFLDITQKRIDALHRERESFLVEQVNKAEKEGKREITIFYGRNHGPKITKKLIEQGYNVYVEIKENSPDKEEISKATIGKKVSTPSTNLFSDYIRLTKFSESLDMFLSGEINKRGLEAEVSKYSREWRE